jgi:hypothetical protein
MSNIMTREEWLEAGREAEQPQHPRGWSYRNDTRRLVATLEVYHTELSKIRTSIDRLGILAEVQNIQQSLARLGIVNADS